MKKPYIIGITGGSGSGKTTFLKLLLEKCEPNNVCLISQDNYYKPKNLQPLDENGIANYDTPESIDIDNFVEDVNSLNMGNEVRKMEYNFNNPNLKTSLLSFKPSPVLILEGVFLFQYKQVLEQLDLKVFIETNEHLRIKRRILRDLTERAYPLQDTLYFLEHHVTPGYKSYVQPYKEISDIIIPNNKGFEKAAEVLSAFIMGKGVKASFV